MSEQPPLSATSRWSVECTLESIDLRVVAILSGIPLVDLSVEFDTHIVRGED